MSNGIATGEVISVANFRGMIFPYAGATAPTGFLLCDGSAVSRTTYADLFTLISTTYGAGDGSTTFNVPDLRSSVMLGKGQKTYTYSKAYSSISIGSSGSITFGSEHEFQDAEEITISTTGTTLKVYKSGQGTDTGSVAVDASGNISAGAGFCAVAPVGTPIYCYSQTSTNFSANTVYWVISNNGSVITVSSTKGGGIAGSGNSGTLGFNTGYTPASFYCSVESTTNIKLAESQANVFAETFYPIIIDSSLLSALSITATRTLSNRSLGEVGGEEAQRLTTAQLPAHKHPPEAGTGYLYDGTGGGTGLAGTSSGDGASTNTGSTGSNEKHNNMPPFVVVNYIIKY